MAVDPTSYNSKVTSRNYIPSSPRLKEDLITVNYKDEPRDVKMPKDNYLPSMKSINQDSSRDYENDNPIHFFMHPWNNSISGTGYGREYWSYQQNPYQY